jgi:hypothetical protein
MRRLLSVVLIMVFGCVNCELGSLTNPDEGDTAPLVSAVRDMPPGLRAWLEHAKDLDAVETLKNANPDRIVADLKCGPGDEVTHKLTMKQLYYFMKDFLDLPPSEHATSSFWDYLSSKLAERGCTADFLPHADLVLVPKREEPPIKANRSYEDSVAIAHFIIALSAAEMRGMPAAVLAALGISVSAGSLMAISGIGLLLCPLSAAVECPDSPSGGDR